MSELPLTTEWMSHSAFAQKLPGPWTGRDILVTWYIRTVNLIPLDFLLWEHDKENIQYNFSKQNHTANIQNSEQHHRYHSTQNQICVAQFWRPMKLKCFKEQTSNWAFILFLQILTPNEQVLVYLNLFDSTNACATPFWCILLFPESSCCPEKLLETCSPSASMRIIA